MQKYYAAITLIFIFLACGCTQTQSDFEVKSLIARAKCIDLCKNSTIDLSNGPCLSDNNSDWNIEGWVCDITHSPRLAADDLPENQCKDFVSGKANHFVELTGNCELIKVD